METLIKLIKIEQFANMLENQSKERLIADDLGCQVNLDNCKVSVKPGKKYVKVDVGSSGKYMIDAESNIFGIKAYGVIHTGHHYGTLDTIDQYNWGGYTARKLA